MRRLVLTVALVLAAPAADAAGFALVEQSASAGGTGGAGTAREDDAAAAWYNPAATADGDGWRSAVGMLGVSPQVSARATDGSWRASTQPALKTPPHVYLSHARGSRTAGLSINVPFGSGLAWPDDWEGRYEIVSSQLQVIRVAPFGGWRFGRVRIAAGPHVDFATLSLERKLDMVDTEGHVAIDLAGWGAGVHASAFLEASPTVDLGLVYRSRTVVAMKGVADFTVPDAFDAKAADQNARSEITLPDLITLGAAWRVSPRVRLVADAGLTVWSVYDEVVIDFENEQTTDARSTPRWQTRPSLRLGAETRLGARATVCGGLLVDPSPAPDDTLAPNSPDANRIGGTIGLGLVARRGLAIDAFYEHLQLLERRSANPESLPASYRGQAHMLGLGIRWTR